MPRIKTFSALLLILCVFLSLLTSCSNTTASETTVGDTSDTSTDATTVLETTARELHEPNVRQLCGPPARSSDGNYIWYYDFSSIDKTTPYNLMPYVIDSAEQYREYVENCFHASWERESYNAIPVWSHLSYGFSLSNVQVTYNGTDYVDECIMDLDTLAEMYNEDFFKERVLVVLWGYFHDTTCQRLLTVINETDSDVMIFMISIGSKNSSPTLMDSYEVIKFIELDRLYLEGKPVLPADGEGAKALRVEWRNINEAAQPETDDESEALLRETYGDVFYYIEPWVLKPET